jgi:hypothetical protein
MRAKAIYAAMVLGGLAAGDGLRAQNPGPCPGMYPAPAIGDYAELRFNSPDQGSMPVRFAIVGEQEVFGRAHHWIEFVSVPPMVGDTVIVQILVPGYPFEQTDIRGYVFKMPGGPPMRIPDSMIPQLAQSTPGPGWKEQCETAADLGNERVTVPAGAFIARHYRAPDGMEEIWIADVPFGMVRMVTTDGEMELTAYGTDGRSYITEEPVDYEPPGGG